MVKRARDHQLAAKNLGFNPGSEYGAEHVLAYKYIIKKYPDMPREEATAKAMQFDDHSAQIFGYFFRKKIDLSIDQALLFKEYNKQAFIYAHRNGVDFSANEILQIGSFVQYGKLKELMLSGVTAKGDLCAILRIKMDGASEVVADPIVEDFTVVESLVGEDTLVLAGDMSSGDGEF